ncbi:MAG: phosphoglucosamine mutase, partial [Alphaproteobacteria bacterium]|nr:phosphoglucosamine mutase [Alphaproteobacteria bacterium]
MADKLFGTDGIRGIAGHFPLNVDFCLKLATVLAQKICTNKKCVAIARDTRISGTMLQSALSAGFTAQGVNVLDLGIIPTPLCTTLTPQLNVDMSIMITASHNPYQDNGLKLITATGDKFSDSQTDELERAIQSPDNQDNQEKIGTVTPVAAGLNNYLQTISAIAPANALKGLKIVLDAANGAFSYILAPVFKHLGAEIISLSDQPNGYNINENCGSQHTENLSKSVKENCYDFGIAVAADGDRIILSDENGNRMNGDQIIGFLATYLQKHQLLKGNGVVATIYSNLG